MVGLFLGTSPKPPWIIQWENVLQCNFIYMCPRHSGYAVWNREECKIRCHERPQGDGDVFTTMVRDPQVAYKVPLHRLKARIRDPQVSESDWKTLIGGQCSLCRYPVSSLPPHCLFYSPLKLRIEWEGTTRKDIVSALRVSLQNRDTNACRNSSFIQPFIWVLF